MVGVALHELADIFPLNVGDSYSSIHDVGFAMGFMLNERAAQCYPGYSPTIFGLQLSVMAGAAPSFGLLMICLPTQAL